MMKAASALSLAVCLLAWGAAYGGELEDGLRAAARVGDYEKVEALVKKSADLNLRDTRGDTPLICAVRAGYDRIVELLLDAGARVNDKDFYGQTPLHLACVFHQPKIAELLIAHGADPNVKGADGRTPLHFACNEPGLVRLFIRHGATVDVGDESGITPLMIACSMGQPETVEILLENRAMTGCEDIEGKTSLLIAKEKLEQIGAPAGDDPDRREKLKKAEAYKKIIELLSEATAPRSGGDSGEGGPGS